MSLFKLTFSSDDSKTSQITLQIITAENLANYLSLKFIKFLPFQVLIQLPVDGFLGFFPSLHAHICFLSLHIWMLSAVSYRSGMMHWTALKVPFPTHIHPAWWPCFVSEVLGSEEHPHKFQALVTKISKPSITLIFTVTEAGDSNCVDLFLSFPSWNRWNLWDSRCWRDIFPQLRLLWKAKFPLAKNKS